MKFLNKFLYFCLFTTVFTLLLFKTSLAKPQQSECEAIIKKIESLTDIPTGLLLGIGKAESGRIKNNEIVIWPWTINHAGKSLFFDTKSDALLYLTNHISSKFKNIDVGCMQINVKWHREHFKSFSSMIDPRTNIEYAAQFLTNLKMAHGSWEKAIKHYHSSTSKLHTKYYAKVAKVWNRKTIDKLSLQQAVLNSDNNSIYFGSMESPDFIFDGYSKKNLDENEQQMLKSTNSKVKNEDNQIYLNAKLIKSNNSYDTEELKRYIKYKSAFLGKNIDMILLFREELSKN